MSNNSNDDIISRLTNETFVEVNDDASEAEVVHLDMYFEKKRNHLRKNSESFLSELVKDANCEFSVLNYVNSSQCYQLNFNGLVVDFPRNWRSFEAIHQYRTNDEFYCLEDDEILKLLSPISSLEVDSSLVFIFGHGKVALGVFEKEVVEVIKTNCIDLNQFHSAA